MRLFPARWAWRQIAAATFAVGATMALLVMLFGRGGGGRSHAMTASERAPSTTPAITIPIVPATVEKSPAAAREQPAAPTAADPGNAQPDNAEAVKAEAPKTEAVTAEHAGDADSSSRRSSRARLRADRDRITRGLSIDPFAESGRGRK